MIKFTLLQLVIFGICLVGCVDENDQIITDSEISTASDPKEPSAIDSIDSLKNSDAGGGF